MMTFIPQNAQQAPFHNHDLNAFPGARSISDDDLCAWCQHCLYRPGEASLCVLAEEDGNWPANVDSDGYAQSCTELRLIFTAPLSPDRG